MESKKYWHFFFIFFNCIVLIFSAPCKGKKCENGGKLNVDTCKCTCEAPYIGARCEQGMQHILKRAQKHFSVNA